jgi:two-component system, OmpR family, response regulator
LPSSLDILIVDDDRVLRTVAELALRLDKTISVRSAGNSGEALKHLKACPADAILLDYNMPDMPGLLLLGEIRHIPSCVDVPVIFLTAMGDRETRDEVMAAGAIGLITKPFNPISLAADIRLIIGR